MKENIQKVDEMLLQLKTENPANQMVTKLPLTKTNNAFSFVVGTMRKNFVRSMI